MRLACTSLRVTRGSTRRASSGPTLALDGVAATSAHGLARLRTAYAGSAVRVRRSSDNAETDVGFVGNELDTSSLLAFVGAGSGFVTTFYDQSDNARHGVQATAANQARIVNAGVLETSGGKPAARFLGNSLYDCGNTAGLLTHLLSIGALVEVTTPAATGANFYDLGGVFGAAAGHVGLAVNAGGLQGGFFAPGLVQAVDAGVGAGLHALKLTNDGTTLRLRANARAEVTASSTGQTSMTTSTIYYLGRGNNGGLSGLLHAHWTAASEQPFSNFYAWASTYAGASVP